MDLTQTINVRMTESEVARLDELRPPKFSRSDFVRRLIREAGPIEVAPSHSEAIQLLAQSARSGHVQAQVALERALRASLKQEDEVGDAIQKLLASD